MLCVLTCLLDCARAPAGGHGHDHGDHADHADHAEADEPAPVAITRWTAAQELYVEFPPPVAGQPMKFHAHVTRLEGFRAVTQGAFRVRFTQGERVGAEAAVTGVARPGIFTPQGVAPGAGEYQVHMVHELDGTTDVFDCGTVTVHAATPAAEAEGPAGVGQSFLKETQWRIPFATAWAEERSLASESEFSATVMPASPLEFTVTAPMAGRVLHAPGVAWLAGARVPAGTRLGMLMPLVQGDDLGRLQASVDEFRVTTQQLEREATRVADLVARGLRTGQEQVDAQNRLETSRLRLRAAEERLARVMSPAQGDGVVLRSGAEGVVTEVGAHNGEAVPAGATLLRLAGTQRAWLRARFLLPPGALGGATPAAVRLADGTTLPLAAGAARLLTDAPVLDPDTRVASWTVEVGPPVPAGLALGSAVVLVMRLGPPVVHVAVPRSAVVELNTRPFVFVQTEGETFEKRAVVTGRTDGDWVQVVSGVVAGERVVTRGAYDIHLSALMGTVESHRH